MTYMNRNILRIEPLIIVAIILAGVFGGMLAISKSIKVTPTAIYAAESTYEAALTAADGYIIACAGTASKAPVLPKSCRSTMIQIQSAVATANRAYQAIKGLESSPPQTIGEDFIAAVTILKNTVPGTT